MPSVLPELPWTTVATDLFQWRGLTYLLIVDYFSRYIEIAKLTNETSSEVIRHTKSVFARHGIPREVVSDNGPQFSSAEFRKFADEYGFAHITSSPKYPQSNGEAERAVRTIKSLLKKAEDPYLALLTYRSTPLQNGYSLVELLMCRRLRTTVPIVSEKLKPSLPDYPSLQAKEKESRKKQKDNFDIRHRARSLEPLLPGDHVWIMDHHCDGTVVEQTAPRSYQVSTPSGPLRRNRRHLIHCPNTEPQNTEAREEDTTPTEVNASQRSPTPEGTVRTRSGRISIPPDRMNPTWQ